MGFLTALARRGGRAVGVVALCAAAAVTCAPPQTIRLPGQSFATPQPVSGTLKAGFGRADITPPPGLGLAGNGSEGRRARGYRTRLYARALVLRNASGQQVAFVALDLAFTSAQLQRRAAWIANEIHPDSLSADRLIVTATHTHSGPGNFLDAPGFNLLASSVGGYDGIFAESLARGVAHALADAIANLRPASVAWGWESLWGFTRNRSFVSYSRNSPLDVPNFKPPPDLPDSMQAVDPTWLMLRVDNRDPETGALRPAGAFSVFAMHGTTNAEVDSLYDGDIQGLLERGLERHIDSLNRDTDAAGAPWPVPRAVHLLANGTEGDVSAVWPEASRCPPPKLLPVGWRPGPRANHPAPVWVEARRARIAGCIVSGREFTVNAARAMNQRVAAMFDKLGSQLQQDIPIGVAFDALSLQGSLRPGRLCAPAVGLSALGGAPDGRTRLMGWRLLGFLGPTIGDGPDAARAEPVGCQGTKRALFWWLQWTLAKLGAVPDFAQFSVARVGNVALATAPAELTIVAGEGIRRAVGDGLSRVGVAVEHIGVVGLTNGYMQYVATDSEFSRQRFESGFTLYGPRTAEVFADHLGRLAERLAPSEKEVTYPIPDLEITPGADTRILRPPRDVAHEPISRRIDRVACAGGVAEIDWIDEHPERLLPHAGPLVRIEVPRDRDLPDSGWKLLTWDDDPWMEVLPLRRVHGGYLWRLRWSPRPAPEGPVRVVLEPRPLETDTIARSLPESCLEPGPGR